MEFMNIVRNRYACKKYSSRTVDKEILDGILEAGRLSPTAKNLQGQRIYVVQSAEDLARIDKLTPCRYGAPTVLIIAYDKDKVFHFPGGKGNSGMEDASIVATHMMLAATAAGVDNCWVNNIDPDKVAQEFGLPDNEEVLLLMDLGYAAEGAGPLPNHFSRKDVSETVTFL